ncbi:MAG: Fic family protein [Alphaproteobacteria bacterium]|nr:Fic family protein [Alphaproteobacteria bacterium]
MRESSVRETGLYQTLGELRYFIPHSLPPKNPPLEINAEMMSLYGEASYALGQLNETSQRLPDPKRFIKAYVIKEALLSSSIEGIHTTLIDVFTHTLGDSRPSKETQLVLNYTQALDAALTMIQDQGLPLVNRVILKSHEALMSTGDGDKSTPGHFRKQSVRVGDLIPPPAQEIPNLMSGLERYINESSNLPPLIKAGLAHVHFEMIHPFLDGNGRIGRLLIVLMLINGGLLKLPILYPSYYFKKHHLDYYQRLDRVRTHGDFEGWVTYYLEAIRDSAIDAHIRAREIETLEIRLQDLIQTEISFARMKDTASSALGFLFGQPVTGIAEMSQKLGKAYNTIQNVLKEFVNHNIVSQNIIHKRNKLYRFEPYLALLEKEY